MATASRIRHVAALAVAFFLLGSCQKSLPTAPSELTTGITIYEHANFAGQSALLTKDVTDLKDYKGPCEHSQWSTTLNTYTTVYDWNDCVSSIKVAPGWNTTVSEDPNYHGPSYSTATDVPNLAVVSGSCEKGGMNDCISSIRVWQR